MCPLWHLHILSFGICASFSYLSSPCLRTHIVRMKFVIRRRARSLPGLSVVVLNTVTSTIATVGSAIPKYNNERNSCKCGLPMFWTKVETIPRQRVLAVAFYRSPSQETRRYVCTKMTPTISCWNSRSQKDLNAVCFVRLGDKYFVRVEKIARSTMQSMVHWSVARQDDTDGYLHCGSRNGWQDYYTRAPSGRR